MLCFYLQCVVSACLRQVDVCWLFNVSLNHVEDLVAKDEGPRIIAPLHKTRIAFGCDTAFIIL